MRSTGLYRVTSIGRPLDPAYPTNRIVLVVMPAVAILSFLLAIAHGGISIDAVAAAALAALGTLGGWALVRELVPDDEQIALIGMGAAGVAMLVVSSASVLLVFAVLLLTRIVNRTVGLEPRVTDSVSGCLLAGWVVYSTGLASLGVAATAAFALDATLQPRPTSQYAFSALSVGVTFLALSFYGLESLTLWEAPDFGPASWAMAAVLVLLVARIFRTRVVRATGDATGQPLSAPRVRAGMWLTCLILVPVLFGGPELRGATVLLWVSAGAAGLSRGAE